MSSGGLLDSSIGGGGDWICSDVTCHHLNFARRTQCNKCSRARSVDNAYAHTQTHTKSNGSTKKKLGTEIGKAAAEKSRGLFSAEDWQCSKCANVNWARRQTCNMCNAPRFCDVEERTGYGGGYNDRGVVEYKERNESDSEYDEFGRLKKRKKIKTSKSNDNNNKCNENKKRTERHDDEDEEDDDDDDDENLAKYDLFGDEDDLPMGGQKKERNNKIKNNSSTKCRRDTRRDTLQTHSYSHTRAYSHYSHCQSSPSSKSTSSSSSSRYRSRSRSKSRSPSSSKVRRSWGNVQKKSRRR